MGVMSKVMTMSEESPSNSVPTPQPTPAPQTPPPYTPAPRPSGRTSPFLFGCLTSIVILFLGGLALIILFSYGLGSLVKSVSEDDVVEYMPTKKLANITTTQVSPGDATSPAVAVIQVNGAIGGGNSTNSSAGSATLVRLLEHVANNNQYGSLILSIDSPGGEVTATDVVYDAVKRVQAAGKPVVVMMGTMACSGGYYISAPADWIIANPNTWTGSIGVIIAGINYEEGLGKLGIKPQVFKSGDFKDMMSGARPMSDDESAYIQSMVMQTYDRFVNIVCEGRKLNRETLEQKHAIDGRVLSGDVAKEVGLVDQLGYFRDAVSKAQQLTHAQSTPRVLLLSEKSPFTDILSAISMESKAPKNISVSLGNSGLPTLRPGVPYALPASYANGILISEKE